MSVIMKNYSKILDEINGVLEFEPAVNFKDANKGKSGMKVEKLR